MAQLDWYFDFISPFSYLQCEHLHRIPAQHTLRLKPVLFGVLLDRAGGVGPAEIPAKRLFTYRHVLWQARRHGVPLRFPPKHPFNPLKLLRLAIALGCSREVVQTIFRFVWRDGRDVDDPQAWNALIEQLGAEAVVNQLHAPAVKDELRRNTDEAAGQDVFGVPTTVVDGELFWGFDATDLLLDYLSDPTLFQEPEMQRLTRLPVGISRKAK